MIRFSIAVSFILFYLFASLSGQSQDKSIKGVIKDKYSNTKIDSVKVTPTYNDSLVCSNENGKFKINLHSKFRDTLVFSHPDYYPFVKRVGRGDQVKLQFINMIPSWVPLDTVIHDAYIENEVISGLVTNKESRDPIEGASIRLSDNKIFAYSDEKGRFSSGVPFRSSMLIATHPDFEAASASIKSKGKTLDEIKFSLKKIAPDHKDTAWKNRKNLIGISLTELLNGGIGLRYERTIVGKHAIGLHFTWYAFGHSWVRMFNSIMDDEFEGFKMAPYYHYYVWRNKKNAGFAEGKILFSYINFTSLDYAYEADPEYEYNVTDSFYTGGFGMSWGWLFFPYKHNYTISISVGYQIFPLRVPHEVEDEHGTIWKINPTWWYIGGPGSVIEFKLILGGIF